MCQRVDDRVPRSRGFGQDHRKFSGIWSDVGGMTVDSKLRNCGVGEPGYEEEDDVDCNHLRDLQFLALLRLAVVRHRGHLLAIIPNSQDDPGIRSNDQANWKEETASKEAVDEGNVCLRPGKVVEGAADPEPLRDVAPPSEPGWEGPGQRPTPDEEDVLEGSCLRRLVHHLERARDDQVSIQRYGGQGVDRRQTTDTAYEGVPDTSY